MWDRLQKMVLQLKFAGSSPREQEGSVRWIAIVLLISIPGFSSTSKGYLVDATCFQAEERNVNSDYIIMPGARDLDFEIRACSPRSNKTTSFVVVLSSGLVLKLDAAGNTKSTTLVNAAGKPGKRQRYFAVHITGTVSKDTLRVDSIAAAK